MNLHQDLFDLIVAGVPKNYGGLNNSQRIICGSSQRIIFCVMD